MRKGNPHFWHDLFHCLSFSLISLSNNSHLIIMSVLWVTSPNFISVSALLKYYKTNVVSMVTSSSFSSICLSISIVIWMLTVSLLCINVIETFTFYLCVLLWIVWSRLVNVCSIDYFDQDIYTGHVNIVLLFIWEWIHFRLFIVLFFAMTFRVLTLKWEEWKKSCFYEYF